MDALDDGSLLTLEPDDPLALEILAHWDELTPSGLERLERQPVLGPRLARLRRAERWLVERTADPTCPDADELYDYGRGPGYRPLPPERRHAIEEHLRDCASCETSVETLELSPPLPLALDEAAAVELAPPAVHAPRRPVTARRLVALAAGLALVWAVFRFGGTPEPGAFDAPLLRGEGPGALLLPQGPVLAPRADDGWTLFAERPSFELAPVEGATRYWVVLYRHTGSAFDEGDAVARLEGDEPRLEASDALVPGHYTWDAWAEVDGLDRSLGARDFHVVDAPELRAEIAGLSLERVVEQLQRARFWSDARALARGLPDSPQRDAVLRWTPPR